MSCGAEQIFPILIPCDPRGWSAHSFQPYFMAAKPKDMVWYGYDTIINSKTEVEFVVYDMADNAYGGIGKQIASLKATVPSELTNNAVDQKIISLARSRRATELQLAEDAIVSRYTEELREAFSAVGGSST
jgi:hypothetical protein